ncbi:MAG: hypothetical protein UT38_C0015G0008 [Microgenomates group bacterium GW2011_GWA2_39_19]|nr:MAG: hypothetical protein UT38_C0015G0008 [Microgenomates group bacterium GW2011_GWA2_39_19]
MLLASPFITGAVGACQKKEERPKVYGFGFDEVIEFYPELKDLEVYEYGLLNADERTIRFINFTDVKLRTDLATQFFIHFSDLASRSHKFSGTLGDKQINFVYVPSVSRREIIFITPDNVPRPYWTSQLEQYSFSATSIMTGDNGQITTASFMRMERTSSEFKKSFVVALEACRMSMRVKSTGYNSAVNQDLQKYVCVSYAFPLAAKQHGLNYKEYKDAISGTFVYTSDQKNVPPIVLSEDAYDMIPNFSLFNR